LSWSILETRSRPAERGSTEESLLLKLLKCLKELISLKYNRGIFVNFESFCFLY